MWAVKMNCVSDVKGIIILLPTLITTLTLYYHYISYQPTRSIKYQLHSAVNANKYHQPQLDEDHHSLAMTKTIAMTRMIHPTSWWHDAKKRLRSAIPSRLDSIHRFCKDGKNSHILRSHQQKKIYSSTLIADEQHLAYCSIAKTGTNTWISHIMRMNVNATLKNAYLHSTRRVLKRLMNRKYMSGEKKVDLSDFIVFTFTRHPFSRLVSGYHHALVGKSLQPKFKELNKRIIKFARTNKVNSTRLFSTVARPKEFVRYLVHQVDTEGWTNVNVHFKSQWQSCPFCLNIFDFVGHQSTFREDVATINSILDLNLKPKLAAGHVDRGKWKVNNFFSTLEAKDVINLHRIFREDFEMLGFDNNISKYINMDSGQQQKEKMKKQ